MKRLAIVVALLVAACASTPEVIRQNSAPQPPAWKVNAPSDGRFLYFVGAKSGASSLDEGKAAATSAAISEVAQFIGVNVSAFGSFVQSTNDAENKARQDVDIKATGQIEGAEVQDVYYESITRPMGAVQISRYDVWVLVKFPKAAAEAERQRQAKEQQAKADNALELYRKAQAAKAAKNLTEVVRLLRLANDSLKGLSKTVDLKEAEFRTSTELTDAVKLLQKQATDDARRSFVTSTETMLGRPVSETFAADRVAAVLASKGFPALAVKSTANGAVSAPADAALTVKVTATVTRSGSVFNQTACVANVKAQVLNNSTQEVVAEVSKEAKGIKANEQDAARAALTDAGAEAGKALVKALLAKEGVSE